MSYNVSLEKLTEYYKTLDMRNEQVKHTLAGIQTLHNAYMQELLYYLVNGIATIDELFPLSINNFAIKTFLISKRNSSVRNHKVFYRNKINELPTYKLHYHTMRNANTIHYLNRLMGNIDTYYTKFILDEFGLKVNSFRSINGVMELYGEALKKTNYIEAKTAFINRVERFATDHSIPGSVNLFEFYIAKLENFSLINDDNDILQTRSKVNPLVFFVLKERYLDFLYINAQENIENVLDYMASDYNADTTKNGYYTVNRLITQPTFMYTHALPNNINFNGKERYIIDQLSRVIQLRYQLYRNVYGMPFVKNTTLLNKEQKIYEDLLDVFTKARELALVLKSNLDTLFPKVD